MIELPVCPICGERGFHVEIEQCLTALRIAIRAARLGKPFQALWWSAECRRIRHRKKVQFIPRWV